MMHKVIIVLLTAVGLVACQETWKGVKKDSKTITRSMGDAGNHLGKKISGALSDDEDKKKKEEDE
ncbi:MAG: hypothetical protein OQK69_11040 [Gammaproteobacteria bacterium]|nr:hypothetical protein [Gammaproteobacteria bacterium]